MSMYLQNLTDYLVAKNGYKDVKKETCDRKSLLDFIKIDLEVGDIRRMTPATLGKIMCSFEVGDVMASHDELFSRVRYSGSCDDLLRELVAACLAFLIVDRLDPESHGRLPTYRRARR